MGIKLFKKNIIQIYTHYIMRLDFCNVQMQEPYAAFTLHKIDPNDLEKEMKHIGKTVSYSHLKKLIRSNRELCEGFVFRNAQNSPIGTIWIMHKGANDLEYRIRTIDAYIFDVYINRNQRGNGYAGEMIRHLMCYLHQKGIDSAYLAVSQSNTRAIQAYQKVGFTIAAKKKFLRAFRINIPFYKL